MPYNSLQMKKSILIFITLITLSCNKQDYPSANNQKTSQSFSGKWHLVKSETYEISSINDETLIREVVCDSIVKISDPLPYSVSYSSTDSLVLYSVYIRDILKLRDVWYYKRCV